jgi:putative membrane protein (TIGR04086 family)
MLFLKYYLNIIFTLLIISIVSSTLSYFNILTKYKNVIVLFVFIIFILINSFLLGNKTKKQGYLEGLKLGLAIILTFIIIRLFLRKKLIEKVIFYFVILISSLIGSIIGINKQEKNT